MALTSLTTYSGTIQKYFETSWMDQPQEDFKTILANSSLLQKATIPAHKGQYAEFRKFTHFSVEAASASDATPKTYTENAEPSSPVSNSATIIQVPFEIIADYIEIGNVMAATDPIDLVKKAKEEMFLLIRRKMHMLTNSHFVKTLTRAMSGSVPDSTTYLPKGFRNAFVDGIDHYENLTQDNVFTLDDFKRARMWLANANIPRMADGRYAAVIDEAVEAQLLEDEKFRDAVKRHQDMFQKANVEGRLAAVEGMTFHLQDDAYRCKTSAQSGAIANRNNSGALHAVHIFGKDAAGYVNFGGSNTLSRTKLMPQFKVQDTSNTGTGPTIGWRLPFQACVLDRRRGVNIFGATRFDESIDDLVD